MKKIEIRFKCSKYSEICILSLVPHADEFTHEMLLKLLSSYGFEKIEILEVKEVFMTVDDILYDAISTILKSKSYINPLDLFFLLIDMSSKVVEGYEDICETLKELNYLVPRNSKFGKYYLNQIAYNMKRAYKNILNNDLNTLDDVFDSRMKRDEPIIKVS